MSNMSKSKARDIGQSEGISVDIPLIRGGKEYYTNKKVVPQMLDSFQISYSQAPEVIINQSIKDAKTMGHQFLSNLSMEELLDVYTEAAKLFIENRGFGTETNDINLEDTQRFITASTGMPILFVKNAFMMFSQAMQDLEAILEILSPNNSVSAFDTTLAYKGDFLYGWVRRGKNLGVIAPSNHPGVHTVWSICSAMKFPTLFRPSEKEGLFGYRFIQALYEAGMPEQSMFYLPMETRFIDSFLRKCDLGIIFGNEETVDRYQTHNTIKTYGPGRSKLIIDESYTENHDLSTLSEFIVGSTLFDGGRSCINASSLLIVGENSQRLAEELVMEVAEELATIGPVDVFNENAKIGAFVDKGLAQKLNAFIEFKKGQDIDIVEKLRENSRLQILDNTFYLLPSVFLCRNKNKKSRLFGLELPFPFMTILPVDDYKETLKYIDRSLVISLFSENQNFAKNILELPHVEKLYLEELTCGINPAEPHEGFPSEFLFRSKAYRPKPGIDTKSFAEFYAHQFARIVDRGSRRRAKGLPQKSELLTKFKKILK